MSTERASDLRPDGTSTIEARGLTVQFGGITALDGIDLEVGAQERCGIIGPNGAGKTTLLDVLSGLRAPTRGHVSFQGVDIAKKGPTGISRLGLRRTFQRQQPFGWLSVEENVLVALEWRGRGGRIVADLLSTPSTKRHRKAHMARVDDVLKQCGLTEVRHDPAAAQPIGNIRLLEFARAIADWPKMLLFDEPTSGLNQRDAERLAQAMLDVNSSADCGFVLVEHDVAFVTSVCDRMVVLHQGRTLADGPPRAVLDDPLVVEAYIGGPRRPEQG
jgi:branched-chain amino acid transport system ATP-binding protein